MEIILKGEPKSTSHIYKTKVIGKFATVYVSAEGKKLKQSYIDQAKKQFTLPPYKENISIMIDLFFGTKRKCDIDNFNKLVLDSLTGILYEDDSQIYELTIRKFYDKENPRVVVNFLNTL